MHKKFDKINIRFSWEVNYILRWYVVDCNNIHIFKSRYL